MLGRIIRAVRRYRQNTPWWQELTALYYLFAFALAAGTILLGGLAGVAWLVNNLPGG